MGLSVELPEEAKVTGVIVDGVLTAVFCSEFMQEEGDCVVVVLENSG
jgi:hypothetical protein